MEFGVLGPVEVHDGGQQLDIGPARQRAVLAVLLLDLGQVVMTERLVSRVWGSDPPPSAVAIYTSIGSDEAGQVRARLDAPAGRAGDP